MRVGEIPSFSLYIQTHNTNPEWAVTIYTLPIQDTDSNVIMDELLAFSGCPTLIWTFWEALGSNQR